MSKKKKKKKKKSKSSKKTETTQQPEVKVEVKKEKGQAAKNIIRYVIAALLLIIVIWIAITIKNALDDTMEVVAEDGQEICANESCIVIDGEYEEGFVEWKVREYWPFFAISIGTDMPFEEGQSVDIICPVELKTDTFQHILTKLAFLYKKGNIKSCDLVAAEPEE